jgi:hypothetical protein
MSTGGAAINAMMNAVVAVNSAGIIRTPNQPTYSRLSVLVTQSQKLCQSLDGFVNVTVVVIVE